MPTKNYQDQKFMFSGRSQSTLTRQGKGQLNSE
jgi:hypothetical protein